MKIKQNFILECYSIKITSEHLTFEYLINNNNNSRIETHPNTIILLLL